MEALRPALMGIVNVTPDSFSDGGQFLRPDAAIEHGLRLVQEGAAILDIGGESTRPGAEETPAAEELARVLPVIRGLAGKTPARLSIDTRKPEVARAAIAAGAAIWNDVSALTFTADSLTVAAGLDCDIVLMHAQGAPKSMQNDPRYDDVVADVFAFLAARIEACERAGVARPRLIADPGIGFGKALAHNLALLRGLERFSALGVPILVGASRKSFIARLDAGASAQDRLGGSIAAALEAARQGASILRVHDVAATCQALAVMDAVSGPSADTEAR